MSIMAEIQRIDNNIASALSACAEKGVAVPEGANSNSLPGLIAQIPTGVELPELESPAAASEIFEGKQAIAQDGSALTGTFTIDGELSAQEALLDELEAVLGEKASGGELPALTNPGTAADLLSGKQLIDGNGNIVTGAIESKDAAEYTPTTADQTIASGKYLTGAQTIKGDANLVPENIVSGVSIFGVAGTAETGSGGASVETVTLSIFNDSPMDATARCAYIDENLEFHDLTMDIESSFTSSTSLTVAKNSILLMEGAFSSHTGGTTLKEYLTAYLVMCASSDIHVYMM